MKYRRIPGGGSSLRELQEFRGPEAGHIYYPKQQQAGLETWIIQVKDANIVVLLRSFESMVSSAKLQRAVSLSCLGVLLLHQRQTRRKKQNKKIKWAKSLLWLTPGVLKVDSKDLKPRRCTDGTKWTQRDALSIPCRNATCTQTLPGPFGSICMLSELRKYFGL